MSDEMTIATIKIAIVVMIILAIILVGFAYINSRIHKSNSSIKDIWIIALIIEIVSKIKGD
jgi:hypothetical protein